MAVANRSSRAALVKDVLLPLTLVLLAMAAGASSSKGLEDGPAVAKSGGRFSDTPEGRKLLGLNFCGGGSPPDFNCSHILSSAIIPKCCHNAFFDLKCFDVGSDLLDRCGSCTTRCQSVERCFSGVCSDLSTDKNNCGFCGHKYQGKLCRFSFCDY